jgi:hypothetical protein
VEALLVVSFVVTTSEALVADAIAQNISMLHPTLVKLPDVSWV